MRRRLQVPNAGGWGDQLGSGQQESDRAGYTVKE